MKSLHFLILFLSLTISVACNKDEDDPCTTDNLSENIIGHWSVSSMGIDLGDVEFKSDGTLIDPDDALVGGEVGGSPLDQKSYTVTSNSNFSTLATDGSSSIDIEYDVPSFSCDEITIEIIGIQGTMRRK